jgi:hypothetical protein
MCTVDYVYRETRFFISLHGAEELLKKAASRKPASNIPGGKGMVRSLRDNSRDY